MFIRKIYYDKATGEVLEHYMMQGSVRFTSVEEDFATHTALEGRTAEDTGVLAWVQPDSTVEEALKSATGISVDVSKQPPELVFDYTPLPEPEEPNPTYTDLMQYYTTIKEAVEE